MDNANGGNCAQLLAKGRCGAVCRRPDRGNRLTFLQRWIDGDSAIGVVCPFC